MGIKIDQENNQLKILIVDEGSTIGSLLKTELKKHESEIFISPRPPENLSIFNWSFLINQKDLVLKKLLESKDKHLKNCIIIFFDNKKRAEKLAAELKATHSTVKVININGPSTVDLYDLEKILWFAFSKSSENIFHIQSEKKITETRKVITPTFELPQIKIKPQAVPFIILGILLIIHFLFIPPLVVASLNLYKGAKALANRNFDQTLLYTRKAEGTLTISKYLYSFARPTLSLFSASSFTDDIFQVDETTVSTLKDSQLLYQKAQSMLALIFKKNKSPAEIESLSNQKQTLSNQIDALGDKLGFLQDKLPSLPQFTSTKIELAKTLDALDVMRKVIPQFDSVFARDGEKIYLLLFANNMELRPGGGFIGSFGLVKVANYTIEEIKVYDVYDADGQLTEHVEPPEPIRKYLEQPNWFLRDSAFSPDFLVNYQQAESFLQKEFGIGNVDGAVMITTTTIQNVLGAIGELYLPDYHEKVNKDNFYLKAQLYAEKDFFPGSIQKKQFLGAVADQLMIKLEESFSPAVLAAFKKSLDEKQMAIQVDDKNLQKVIDSLYWSGRVIEPLCTNSTLSQNCVTDYLFSYDANLGVNKANFFVKRSQSMDVTLRRDGTVQNEFTLTLRNEAVNDTFPGGTYKNYLQIMIPKGSILKSVTKNGAIVEHVDEFEDIYKTVGTYIEVPPRQQAVIKVSYRLPQAIDVGQGQYQLIVQKQIGSSNSDFQIKLSLPGNYHIARKNFGGVVKEGEILYNTSLSADKIFLVEFTKE